jgi:riboflavin synthase
MFTGIITAIAEVRSVERRGKNLLVGVALPRQWCLERGESVSVDGICSTVARLGRGYFEVEYMPETLAKTTAGRFAPGDVVNLERSLRAGDRIGGHLVQGHVDTTGTVSSVRMEGNSRVVQISFPPRYARFIAEKGAICVNGVSLTVVKVERRTFSIALVPYTLRHTNLRMVAKGDAVNIEVDTLARYLASLFSK